ncbi:MAG: metallophosphoesterase [Phycisphaerales bacterium]
MPAPRHVDLASATQVVAALREGTDANLNAACRAGSIDHVRGPGTLLATGDLHDNSARFQAVVELAGFEGDQEPAHLTLHELIHGDNLIDDMDPSYRALVRAAALKVANPEHVHVLLANHELSQIAGRGVIKNGLNCVKAFNDGVDYVFGDDAPDVHAALAAFIRSMPLALRCTPADASRGDVLCAHSLPADDALEQFDTSILERPLTEADYQPRTGSAHMMTWGRNQSPATLTTLARRWNAGLFILGHEKADSGWLSMEPCGLILNTDHQHACVCRLTLDTCPALQDAVRQVEGLQPG